MNHADVKRCLPDYLEGDLPLDDRALVDGHLDDCPDCAREVAELEQTIALLRGLPEPETPPMIAANVMRRIRAGETAPGPLTRFWRGLSSIFEPSFVLPASAAAAAALVVVVLQQPDSIGGWVGPEREADGLRRSAEAVAPSIALDAAAGRGASSGPTSMLTRRAPVAPSALVASTAPLGGLRVERVTESPARIAADAFSDRVESPTLSRSGPGRLAAGPPPGFVATPRAQGFAGLPSAMPVAGPLTPGMLGSLRSASTSFASASDAASAPGTSHGAPGLREPASGADPRDHWLAVGLARPVDFARFVAGKSLAEQELWIARLADRAVERALLEPLVRTLEETGDATAGVVAGDLRAEGERVTARPAR